MATLKIRNPSHRTMIRAQVRRVTQVSPHFTTITFTSPDVTRFDYLGFDQCIRVFFPRPGQTELRLPSASGNSWIVKFYLLPAATRPFVRNYTIRELRPESQELDIEFVIHGEDSPASSWASHARPGDEVGLFPEGIQYLPPRPDSHRILVGDESAVPAILSILDHIADSVSADVYLEVPATADIRALPDRPRVQIRWLARDAQGGVPGQAALAEVSSATLSHDGAYVFIAGESGLATGLRRHLVTQRNVPKSAVTFVGYWKHGRSALG